MFGVYHPAKANKTPAYGVVVCPPILDEYMHSHRAVRQLAALAARKGLPTLRFDYYGTGDSGGEGTDVSMAQCEDDARTAIAELKDVSGVPKVFLVGLRVGASVAARVARGRFDVSRIVLWDPVVRGRAYLREVTERHRLIMESVDPGTPWSSNGTEELCGFPVTERLRDELDTIDLTTTAAQPEKGMLVSVCEANDGYTELQISYKRRGLNCAWQHVAGQRIWEEKTLAAHELVPTETLKGIVEWLV